MENRIFVNRKGDKWPLLAEEISYDLGKTWQRTGKTKYDEDNIEYDSCECNEQYEWSDEQNLEVNCQTHKCSKLKVKYGCNDFIDYEKQYIKIENEPLGIVNDCEQEVFHKTTPKEDGEGFDEWIWVNNEWVKITCEDE